MSGHSKWSQIKRQKAATDKKRGGLFTKLANAITIAAKQGGGSPEQNFKLRLAVERAKSANMPNDNIERAIKRGTGELSGTAIEEIIYEGYGPSGTAIVIESATDNRNRTTAVIRSILSKYQGKLGSTGNVLWMFTRQGVLCVEKSVIPDKESFMLEIIDAGADDIQEAPEGFTIITAPEKLQAVQTYLENKKIPIVSANIELVPKNKLAITDTAVINKLQGLFEELESSDEVNNFFSNADL